MEQVKRGYEPKDAAEFGPKAAEKLNASAVELRFLLDRGYDIKSASAFIGNHRLLSERQRLALARMVSPEKSLANRKAKEISQDSPPKQLWLDGFNTIITLEVALSQSLLLEGQDGTIRDLAGLRGTYRIVDKTLLAVDLLFERLEALGVEEAVFYLDRQVSNSGRLRALLLDKAELLPLRVKAELDPGVDGLLARRGQVVTADAIILDQCESFYNLNRSLIADKIPDARIFRLQP